MKLYSHPISTFSRRVRIAALEKGLALETIDVERTERQTDAYRAINPYGRIPALVDGEFVLFESSAILEYLEARFPEPALVPPDPAGRALAVMHVKLCDIEFTPHALLILRPKRLFPPAEWNKPEMAVAARAVAKHYEQLARALGGREYLVADRFTWADLAYLPFLHFHALLEVELPANLAAWAERLAARPSARATVPAR